MDIMGSSPIEGVPKTIVIEDSDICEALAECIEIVVRLALDRTAPKLSTDIYDHGANEWRFTHQESRQTISAKKPACPSPSRTKSIR
jgi:hypothetical protein